MTYWADNIKFIKDIQDSKYKKIEDALTDLKEHSTHLNENKDNKKSRDGFLESCRALELMDQKEIESLAETMFKDMPDTERVKEEDRLKEAMKKLQEGLAIAKEGRSKFGIQGTVGT